MRDKSRKWAANENPVMGSVILSKASPWLSGFNTGSRGVTISEVSASNPNRVNVESFLYCL